MLILISALTGALGVAAGAFGAHALKSRLPAELLAVWNTAAHYQLLHAAVLLALALYAQSTGRAINLPWGLMFAGVVLFSGSLYAMCLSGLRTLGAITPVGGLLMIAGWLAAGLLLRH